MQSDKDHRLFELLAEHSRLEEKSPRSNWYTTFSSSVELKSVLKKRLGGVMLEQNVLSAINTNCFPLLTIKIDCNYEQLAASNVIRTRVTLSNVGGAPAFNLQIRWKFTSKMTSVNPPSILAPGQSIEIQAIIGVGGRHTGAEDVLCYQFQSPCGCRSIRTTSNHANILPGHVLVSGCNRLEQRISRSRPIRIQIDESAQGT